MTTRETPQTARTNRSYADYLEDVGGESEDDDLKRLDTSGSSDVAPLTAAMTTPHNKSGMVSPQPTEPRSFVNGLLSPFSPLLKQKEQREEYLKYLSLQPCRKVSVVVRILPCDEDDGQQQRCVFPHIKGPKQPVIRKPKTPRNMVVVNPSAFGKYIPSHVTMDTARLVAQVANISSEDWVRLYEFHHVMWPSPKESPLDVPDEFSTLDSLSRAVTQDALVEHQSSLLISLGQGNTCMGSEDGVWPRVISHCQAWMEEKSICTLTMYEVLEEKDSFRDLLNRKNKDISLRHVDMKGAVLNGLTQVQIDSMPALLESLLKRKKSNNTVVGTLNIWSNAVSYELKKAPNAQITCVELAAAGANKKNPGDAIVHRYSTMCLGQALRQLLLHSSFGTDLAISFRDTSLTKVLQRSLESAKIVLLASVSQLSQDYESTLATLNYLRRLLVKPGRTASSPFKKTDSFDEQLQPDDGSNASPSHLTQYADDRYLLEKIVGDPRQRLAKLLKKSPPQKADMPELESTASEDDYQPIDYMENWESQLPPRGEQSNSWESPPAKKSLIPKPSTRVPRSDPNRLGRVTPTEPNNPRDLRKPMNAEPPEPYPENETAPRDPSSLPMNGNGQLNSSPYYPARVGPDTELEPDSGWDESENGGLDYADQGEDSDPFFPVDNQVNVSREPNGRQEIVDPPEPYPDNPYSAGLEQAESELPQRELLPELNHLDPLQFEKQQRFPEEDERHNLAELEFQGGNFDELPGDAEDHDSPSYEEPETVRHSNLSNEEEWTPADSPTGAGMENPLDPASNLEYSDTEHAIPEEDPDHGEQKWLNDDEPYPSNVSSTSNKSGQYDEQDLRDPLESDDSWDQKVKGGNQIEWIPEIPDDSQLAFPDKTSGSPAGGHPGWPKEDPMGETLQIGQSEEEQNSLSNDARLVESQARDTPEEEILFVEEQTDNNGDNTSDEVDLPSPKNSEGSQDRTPWEGTNKQDSSTLSTDHLNTSHWTEWGADHSEGDDLDLEPQTQYDLPESPRPTPDGTEEEEWYASPGRVQVTRQSRATTPRSSNREIHKKTTPINKSNIAGSSKTLLQSGQISRSTKISSVSRSTALLRKDISTSNGSAFSSVSPSMLDSPRTSDLHKSVDSSSGNKDTGDQLASVSGHSSERFSGNQNQSIFEDGGSMGASKEIETLESFVGQIQGMHQGLWKSSALSLHRLKESLHSQGTELEQLLSQREVLQSQIAEIRDESKKTSEEYDDQVQRYEEEVQDLQGKLEKVVVDKAAVEKIADEAISEQDRLERRVKSLHEELNASRMKTEFTRDEVEDLKQAMDGLRQRLQETALERDKLEGISQEGNRKRADLELSIKSLEEEQSRYRKSREADDATIQNLKTRLSQRETEMGELKDENAMLARLRRDDKTELERIVDRSRNLGTAVESVRKEKSRLEENRRNDQNLIKELQDELRSVKQLFQNLENEHAKCHELQLEKSARLDTIQAQYREVRLRFDSLHVEHENVVELRREHVVETEQMQREIKRLKSAIADYERETSNLKEMRREDQASIRRLESDLRVAGTRSDEMQGIQRELTRLKQENVDIETLMAKRKTEYFDALKQQDEKVAQLKEASGSLQRELADVKQRAEIAAEDAESEINQLKDRVGEYETELDLCIRQRDDFALKLESTEESNSTMAMDLEAKEREIESYREEILRLEKDVISYRERETSRAVTAERELERMRNTRSELELKLSETRQQRDDARNDFHKETLSRQSLSNELEMAKDKLQRQENVVEELSLEIQRARTEKSSDGERIFSMEASLHRFRSETKEKLDRVVREHKESKQQIERERQQNEILADKNRSLQSAFERVKRERDECIRSLEMGRSRLAMMATRSVVSSNSNGELDVNGHNIYSTLPATGFDLPSHVTPADHLPELYLTDFSTGQLAALRAEEIVAYLAMSAKSSLQESQDEASHLRSQVYRLEEEKESEVASLKTKIRHLQRELSDVDGIKSRSQGRRPRYY